MTNSLLLTLSGLNVYYGRLHVLKGVSLHVNEGEVVALLGANGAGKTTALRAISGLLRPASGTLTFAGQKIAGHSPERLVRLGITQVPEGRQVFGPLSVQDNLLLGAYTRLRRVPTREKIQTRHRVLGEFGIVFQLLVKFGLQRGIFGQHQPRLFFGHVAFHVFLALKTVVEAAPCGDGVGGLWLKNGHDQVCLGLRDGHK